MSKHPALDRLAGIAFHGLDDSCHECPFVDGGPRRRTGEEAPPDEWINDPTEAHFLCRLPSRDPGQNRLQWGEYAPCTRPEWEKQAQTELQRIAELEGENGDLRNQLSRAIHDGHLRRCDNPACNCLGYHSHYAQRMMEEGQRADDLEAQVDRLSEATKLAERALDLRRQLERQTGHATLDPWTVAGAERKALQAIQEALAELEANDG